MQGRSLYSAVIHSLGGAAAQIVVRVVIITWSRDVYRDSFTFLARGIIKLAVNADGDPQHDKCRT